MLSEPLIECVPNFSEGRDASVVAAILGAMHQPGVRLLDYSRDHDHNRSVITVAGPAEAILESAVRGAVAAAERIDLRTQRGVHPRIGSADVIPFVPLGTATLEQCAVLAHRAGQQLWARARIPSYFYEAAALRPDRALLEDVRRGQFEGLREAVEREPARRPDVGGPALHPSAGASAIGARRLLIAYNIFLDTGEIAPARTVARQLRAANGGLPGVKALGLMVEGRAQVSINITDFRLASPSAVYAAVTTLAAGCGARPVAGELIGLLPEAAYEHNAAWVRQLEGFTPEEKLLEQRLEHPLPWPAP